MRRIFSAILVCLLLFAFDGFCKGRAVLAIGNSFSADAVEQYLWELAAEAGDTLVIGNAYIGGCNIDRHLANYKDSVPAYSYRLVENGVLHTENDVTLQEIIKNRNWEIISLQQASPLSGRASSFVNLKPLIACVEESMPDKDAEIIWHNTWAYAKDFDSDNFKYYNYDQEAMFDSITHVMNTLIPEAGIKRVVPSGIAIQKARGVFGDVLNRDGYHLSIPLGRYVAACVWAEFLTGKDVRNLTFKPSELSEEDALKAREVAHEAVISLIE